MADLLGKYSELIGSAIVDRIVDLGGTERDVQRIAESAALAVFTWSASEGIGGALS